MKKFCLAIFCLCVLSSIGFAQGSKKADFFIGYSHLRAEGIPNRDNPGSIFDEDFFDRRAGLHGVNISGTGYFAGPLGITGDFSFHRDKSTDDFGAAGADTLDTQVYYFMAGPKLKFRNASRVEPFVHALAGGAHTRFKVSSVVNTGGGTFSDSFTTSATDFAAAVGGGIDIRISDNFQLRLIQVDYAPIFLKDRSIQNLGGSGAIVPFTLEGQRQDNVRISIGLVF
jgi:opacity protein-like surface antigen